MGGIVRTVKENAEALVVATKEIGLTVNADKTKYMVCLGIGMQGGVTVCKLIIVQLKEWKCSNIWERR